MEKAEVYNNSETEFNEPAHPPPYVSGPPPGSYSYGHSQLGPNQYGYDTSVTMVQAPIGVTSMGVGVVGTQVGVVGMNVGHTTVPVIIGQQISPKPTRLICKSCNNDITTRVESKATWKTHFFAGLLCLMGCWCCVCIPYCTDSCLNSDHYCPNCNAYIASYVT